MPALQAKLVQRVWLNFHGNTANVDPMSFPMLCFSLECVSWQITIIPNPEKRILFGGDSPTPATIWGNSQRRQICPGVSAWPFSWHQNPGLFFWRHWVYLLRSFETLTSQPSLVHARRKVQAGFLLQLFSSLKKLKYTLQYFQQVSQKKIWPCPKVVVKYTLVLAVANGLGLQVATSQKHLKNPEDLMGFSMTTNPKRVCKSDTESCWTKIRQTCTSWVCEFFTPGKFNMEPQNEGLEDVFPFQMDDFQVPGSMFVFPGLSYCL